jgi:carbamoyl-phosphate synthase large subunit
MPKREEIKKVLVIGSGAIVIGQAAEFDYSGTQACKALKEEGMEVVLINSNPATVMTDLDTADKVYIEPITLDFVKAIIRQEKPDGILASLGGQTALNMALSLWEDGILKEMDIEVLGTPLDSIRKAEDRELFKETMQKLGQKVSKSVIVNEMSEALSFGQTNGFPIIVRPAFTLGGSGGGMANNMEALRTITAKGLKLSPIGQVLLEQSVAGWKEVEYEVMRDGRDNCVIVCNMENVDPVGVHTGDSIVVAPSQTLSDKEYQMLRYASFQIIRELGIQGGCNIQFALHPKSLEYVVIEVNPRVSRSSALASKATGYPIARVAAKIAIGLTLDEIKNTVTQSTYAFFEPSLDYVVTKVPRWAFDKFGTSDRTLGTQMKATGEVMAIGRTFEESLLKAIDSLDVKFNYQLGLTPFENQSLEALLEALRTVTDERIFMICSALQKGATVMEIATITQMDPFYIHKFHDIVVLAEEIKKSGLSWLDYDLYDRAKKMGFGDSYIANLVNEPLEKILQVRDKYPIKPVYKMVDTCAGEFLAKTPYYYSTYEEYDEVVVSDKEKVLVIGSGPIRIGQGIEFDYCSVHCIKTLKELGIESIILNNNPETVSTDFDTADKLYFEPLTKECVLDLIRKENPKGVIVQFGGQTALNLASELSEHPVRILGTSIKSMDQAENRDMFLKLAQELQIPIPKGGTAFSVEQALGIAKDIRYPLLVRPSYVLGGRAMEIVHSDEALVEYMKLATDISPKHPVLLDQYIFGKEVECDGICDGEDVFIPGIMEHIERAGVHSGDSICVYPPRSVSQRAKETIRNYATKLAKALEVVGLFNIQFVVDQKDTVHVLEVNPRASRTVPVLTKITGIPMVGVATKLIMGQKLKDLGYGSGLATEGDFYAVKVPVFSFSKIPGLDTFLGPEMKSTGEVMGVDKDYTHALYKALVGAGMKMRAGGVVLLSVCDQEKEALIPIAKTLLGFGFSLEATPDTHAFLCKAGLKVDAVLHEEALRHIREDRLALVINTPTIGKNPASNGYLLRRAAVEFQVLCITSLDTAQAVLEVFDKCLRNETGSVYALDAYGRG